VINRRFPYLHIAFILLLSIVFIPPAFAIEARYVKVLIDPGSDPNVFLYAFRVHLFDASNQRIDDVSAGVQLVSGTQSAYIPFLFSDHVTLFLIPVFYAFTDDLSRFYACQYALDCSVTIDLRHSVDIATIKFYTPDLSTTQSFYDSITSTFVDLEVSPVTDYRIMVSTDNFNWTLSGMATNAAATTRTDTITLEDLGGGMDIDINYVVALFLSILVLGFLRQIFF